MGLFLIGYVGTLVTRFQNSYRHFIRVEIESFA